MEVKKQMNYKKLKIKDSPQTTEDFEIHII